MNRSSLIFLPQEFLFQKSNLKIALNKPTLFPYSNAFQIIEIHSPVTLLAAEFYRYFMSLRSPTFFSKLWPLLEVPNTPPLFPVDGYEENVENMKKYVKNNYEENMKVYEEICGKIGGNMRKIIMKKYVEIIMWKIL